MQRANHEAAKLIVRKDTGFIREGYFYRILIAAIEGDQSEIDHLMKKDFFTIDVKMGFGFGLITPAGYLEYREKYEAVEFLIKNGADVDYIAFGAAMNGDRPRAGDMRKYLGANPTAIARGAAHIGDDIYLKILFLHYGADEIDIVLGYMAGKKYQKAIEFINEYGFRLPPHRKGDFWRTTGMSVGAITSDVISVWNAFKRNPSLELKLKPDYIYDFYYGAGLSGKFDASPDLEEPLKSPFYRGVIEGGHNEILPEIYFKPNKISHLQPQPFHLEPCLKGCNLDYLERCLEQAKSDRALRIEFYRWLYYYTILSNNIQLIRCLPHKSNLIADLVLHGYRLTDISIYRFYEHTYKSISYIFKTRNRNLINNLNKSDFLTLLPNKEIATHLMAFDDNDEFQKALLARFDKINMNINSAYYYDLHKVYSDACKIKKFMKIYRFNLEQAMAMIHSHDLRNFLLNTCKDITEALPLMKRDICAEIITNLCDLTRIDSINLITKVRYYRHTIQAILRIADQFKSYANTHLSDQGAHAASLAQVLAEARTNDEARQLIVNEWVMLKNPRTPPKEKPSGLFTSTMQSALTLFNTTVKKAKDLYENDNTPAHQKPYLEENIDDDYESMLMNSLAKLGSTT